VDEEQKGAGWIAFAGVMVLIIGILNCFWGIAAIDNAHFFTANAQYIISDLNFWGWVILIIGIVQIFAAFSIWAGGEFGRWIGIIGAAFGSVAALLSIPGNPWWALAVFTIDILIIYALVVYGGHYMGSRSR
jgi:hypothetical protein